MYVCVYKMSPLLVICPHSTQHIFQCLKGALVHVQNVLLATLRLRVEKLALRKRASASSLDKRIPRDVRASKGEVCRWKIH